jgi:hypothetical protein
MTNSNLTLEEIEWASHRTRLDRLFQKLEITTLRELLNLKPENIVGHKGIGTATLRALVGTLRNSGLMVYWEKGKKLGGPNWDRGKMFFCHCPHCCKTLKIVLAGDALTISRRR